MHEVRVIIPTRRRVGSVTALSVFPDAELCVGEDEADAYHAEYPKQPLLVHPADVTGIGPLRQWILDTVPDEKVFQVDDDVQRMSGQTLGWQQRYGPAEARSLVEDAAEIAKCIGTSVFGFSQSWDVRKFTPTRPFSVKGWVGGAIGFVGRKHRFDTNLRLRADIDFCLTCLRYDRIVWIDSRFSFVHSRFSGDGGNAVSRSKERHDQEIAYMRSKWGQWMSVRKVKTTTMLDIRNVQR